MAYVDRLVFSLLWVSPDIIIGYFISISNLKGREMYILWGCRKNTNVLSVLELWVSEVKGVG